MMRKKPAFFCAEIDFPTRQFSLIFVIFVILTGCSAPRERHDADSDIVHDADEDSDVDFDELEDSSLDADDADIDDDDELPPLLPDIQQCGNGVVEPGEECDDFNRMNGDGCDWSCQLDGTGNVPTWDEAPAVFELEEDTFVIDDGAPLFATDRNRISLVWTGSELATAFFTRNPTGPPHVSELCCRRFDSSGRLIGSEYFHQTEEDATPGVVDLIWLGSSFGLFFVEVAPTGIGTLSYLRLDREGKPLGVPVVVHSGPGLDSVSADYDPGEGYIVLWNGHGVLDGPSCTGGRLPGYAVWAARVSIDGILDEDTGPILVEDNAQWAAPSADVVVGAEGYGASVPRSSSDENPGFSFRFIWLPRDLSTVRFSGLLSQSYGGDVLYLDGEYIATWIRNADTGCDYEANQVALGRFNDEGLLLAPPIVGDEGMTEPTMSRQALRAAAYPDGVGLLISLDSEDETVMGGTRRRLLFRSLDSADGPLRAPIEILSGPRSSAILEAFALAWTGDSFAVLYQSNGDDGMALRLRLIVPSS